MNQIIKYAVENNASDIHITENKVGWVRVKGKLFQYGEKVTLSEIDEFIELVIPGVVEEYTAFRERRRINPIDGVFKYMFRRFRINIYKGMDGVNLAIRLLSDKILNHSQVSRHKKAQFL